jgi:hypothetical protein
MLEPGQFVFNETWVVFRLNDAPVTTQADGDFDVICLMDAASGYIVGNEFVPAGTGSTPHSAIAALIQTARSKSTSIASTLLLSAELGVAGSDALAARFGMEIRVVDDSALLPFVSEARQGFRAHVAGGRMQ